MKQSKVAVRRSYADGYAHGVNRAFREINRNEYVRSFEHNLTLLPFISIYNRAGL